jgi:hypothetical protein
MKVIPVTYVKGSEFKDEPHNNLANHEIMLLGEEDCDDDTTLIFDSHYMDAAGI